MTLEVALENLAADAEKWAGAADAMSNAAKSLAGLTLGEFVFTDTNLAATQAYEEVRAHTEALARAGADELNATVATLRQVRADYAENENAAAARYRGLWTYDG